MPRPTTTSAYALGRQGQTGEAIAEYREAIRLRPDDAGPTSASATPCSLQGKLDEAIAEFREVIRIWPREDSAHYNLGATLSVQGRTDEAIAEFREAVRLRPENVSALGELGNALGRQGKTDEAIAEYREVIRLRPLDDSAHANLGDALSVQGKADEAIAEYREVIRLRPDMASAHIKVGRNLQERGKLEEALSELRMAQKLVGTDCPVAQEAANRVRSIERMIILAPRLPAILKGDETPKDATEGVEFARLCIVQGRHAGAARLYRDAFALDPKLADNLNAAHRYNAACNAALAGSGQGQDDPPPDESARATLRDQARDWLKADLTLQARAVNAGTPEGIQASARAMAHWKADADLAGVRDAEALAKLPEAERKDWQALWAEVNALLARVGAGQPK